LVAHNVKLAALGRVFGFEIMPAPPVVASPEGVAPAGGGVPVRGVNPYFSRRWEN
jgi:hypothetical protein